MKYYFLQQLSLNIRETGTQFQSVEGIKGDIQNENLPFEGEINFAFKLPEPYLEKKANATTRINAVMVPSWFLIFKKHFVDMIIDFNIGKFQTWNLKVHHNNAIIDDYMLFYLTTPIKSEIIDFDKSHFTVGKWSDWNYKGEDLKIVNTDNFQSINKKFYETDFNIKPKELFIDLSNMKLDFFRISDIPLISGNYFVSEKVKNFIDNQVFTGIELRNIEEIDNRIKVKY